MAVYICLYISRHVWKTDVLNWPAGQPLNLTCSIRKIHEEDDNQIRGEHNASSLHGEYQYDHYLIQFLSLLLIIFYI